MRMRLLPLPFDSVLPTLTRPDDPAQHVQGGVGPHQSVPALPVELAAHPRPDGRHGAVDGVPGHVPALAHVHHGRRAAVPPQDAGVVGPAAAGDVERGAVEGDPVVAGCHDGGFEHRKAASRR